MLHPFITYVNSKYRSSGTSTDFSFTIDIPPPVGEFKYDSACILQASIPKSFYLINANRNTFTLIEEGVNIPISIPIGNYSRRSFALTLINLLTSNSTHGYTYNVLIPNTSNSPDTGKFLFTVSAGLSILFSFGSSSSPAEQMGFLSNSTVSFVAHQLYSATITNFQPHDSIYILCDNVVNGPTQILQEIFTASPDYSMLNFSVGMSGGVQANKKQLKSVLTNTWRFSIVTPNFEHVDFEGLNLVFSLLIWKSGVHDINILQDQPNLTGSTE